MTRTTAPHARVRARAREPAWGPYLRASLKGKGLIFTANPGGGILNDIRRDVRVIQAILQYHPNLNHTAVEGALVEVFYRAFGDDKRGELKRREDTYEFLERKTRLGRRISYRLFVELFRTLVEARNNYRDQTPKAERLWKMRFRQPNRRTPNLRNEIPRIGPLHKERLLVAISRRRNMGERFCEPSDFEIQRNWHTDKMALLVALRSNKGLLFENKPGGGILNDVRRDVRVVQAILQFQPNISPAAVESTLVEVFHRAFADVKRGEIKKREDTYEFLEMFQRKTKLGRRTTHRLFVELFRTLVEARNKYLDETPENEQVTFHSGGIARTIDRFVLEAGAWYNETEIFLRLNEEPLEDDAVVTTTTAST
ncbi:hypothetical protein OQA88_7115 [Cercophora sp. LCS_1]